MTGFSRAEGVVGGVRWVWEARSVNGRTLDVKVRLPPGYDAYEPQAREAAGLRFKRGSLQTTLTIKAEAGAAPAPRINHELIEHFLSAGGPYIASKRVEPARWDGVLALRGVLIADETAEPDALAQALAAPLTEGLARSLDGLVEARMSEGRAITAVFEALLSRMEELVVLARASGAAAPAMIAARIKARLAALAPEIQFDAQRLAQEASLAAMRADVQEELERLATHCADARRLIAEEAPAGRKLDFLAQEFAREANTLCAKSQDAALTRLGLDLKTAIDQFKEQAANVE